MTFQAYLQGGVAVITGGGSGLGAAMAFRFAKQGMRIAAIDFEAEHAERTCREIRDGGGTALALQCDISDRAAVDAAARAVEAEFGSCTVVCANVGVQQFGAIENLTENDWRWVLNVNVMGTVYTVDAFLPLLRKAGGSRHFVMTSSAAAYSPGVRMAAYTASKYALTGYAETLRKELEAEGIGVSILFPGSMTTSHIQSSQKSRPAQLGASAVDRKDIDAMMASRGLDTPDLVATAEYATRHLIEDLAYNRRYIITHGNCRTVMVSNFAELLEAHDRAQLD